MDTNPRSDPTTEQSARARYDYEDEVRRFGTARGSGEPRPPPIHNVAAPSEDINDQAHEDMRRAIEGNHYLITTHTEEGEAWAATVEERLAAGASFGKFGWLKSKKLLALVGGLLYVLSGTISGSSTMQAAMDEVVQILTVYLLAQGGTDAVLALKSRKPTVPAAPPASNTGPLHQHPANVPNPPKD